MLLTIWVKPGVRAGAGVAPPEGDEPYDLIVRVPARPVDGAANAAVIRALADHFGVRKSDVSVVSGATSRVKRVQIEGR